MTERPTKRYHNNPAYNYLEVVEYMEEKYKFDHRDYAGKYKQSQEAKDNYNFDEVPYQDFWHQIMDNCDSNGSYMYVDYVNLQEYSDEQWIKEICQYYIDEFGEEEASEMFYWVSW